MNENNQPDRVFTSIKLNETKYGTYSLENQQLSNMDYIKELVAKHGNTKEAKPTIDKKFAEFAR